MRFRALVTIALAAALAGCDAAGTVTSADSELEMAPSASELAALELPGCDALSRATSPAGRWQIVAHPADSRLALLSRDGCPVCIDTPERAREELGRLFAAAGLETPAQISSPVDDDPVPIRGEERSTGDQAEGQPGGEQGNGGQDPPPGGGASDPRLASSPQPSDDPVPIRAVSGRLMLIGSAGNSTK